MLILMENGAQELRTDRLKGFSETRLPSTLVSGPLSSRLSRNRLAR